MKEKVIYNKILKFFMKFIFSFFYDKKYLQGKYFDIKRMGWYWAFRGLRGKIFSEARKIPWPIHPTTIISNPKNIEFCLDDLHIFQTPGCYWQNHNGRIVIGNGCHIAPNVGLITTNHDVYKLENHLEGKDIVIGEKSWVGMNSVILPGIVLGNNTVVGAGSVMTKSFPEGNCIIGGNPAKLIKKL